MSSIINHKKSIGDKENPLLSSRGSDLTLCLIFDNHLHPNKILLGMKKRGFGHGKWNGFGGHPEKGETLVQATVREVKEECNLSVQMLEERGVLTFHTQDDPHPTFVHLFVATTWSGDPEESEEMLPQWYSLDDIPYGSMWADDKHWLPKIIKGEYVKGTFHFDNKDNLLNHILEDGKNQEREK